MKRVLIIANRFPPFDNPGARRPAGLYKYLGEFGWEPWVVTMDPARAPNPFKYVPRDHIIEDESRVIRTNFSHNLQMGSRVVKALLARSNRTSQSIDSLKGTPTTLAGQRQKDILSVLKGIIKLPFHKAGRLVWDVVSFPDSRFGWYPHALRSAQRLHEEVPYDAIISTSGPETSHLVARSLLRRCSSDLIWVADFRDLWSQKHNRERTLLRKWLDRRLECFTLSQANAITAVSKPFADQLRDLSLSVPVEIIMNGFDPQDYAPIQEVKPPRDRLIITYAGHIHRGFRDPVPLFRVVHRLLKSGSIAADNLELRFFGGKQPWLENQVRKYRLGRVVSLHDRIPREQVLFKLAESSVLLLLDWNDPRELGYVPAKLFEYMGCARPIWAIGGSKKGSIAQLLQESQAGIHTELNEDAIDLVLMRFYESQMRHGRIDFLPPSASSLKYTHLEMANQFASLLNRLMA